MKNKYNNILPQINYNNPLPPKIKKNIQQHPVSGHFYIKITYTNHNGKVNEKFIYVSQNGIEIKDKGKDIYLNKNTGEIITGNGKRYVVDPHNKTLVKTRNGFIIQDNNHHLPKRTGNSAYR